MKENLFSLPMEQVDEESKNEHAKTGNLALLQSDRESHSETSLKTLEISLKM